MPVPPLPRAAPSPRCPAHPHPLTPPPPQPRPTPAPPPLARDGRPGPRTALACSQRRTPRAPPPPAGHLRGLCAPFPPPAGPSRRRRAGQAAPAAACHGGRLTVRQRSRARLRHDPGGQPRRRGWAGSSVPGSAGSAGGGGVDRAAAAAARGGTAKAEAAGAATAAGETDPSADLRLLILTAGNKQCAGAGGMGRHVTSP